jgi:hypothetical protein
MNTIVEEFNNYTRVKVYQNNGIRVTYTSKVTNKVFSDGFHFEEDAFRRTREGERIFIPKNVIPESNS